jgi:hypothetical protein
VTLTGQLQGVENMDFVIDLGVLCDFMSTDEKVTGMGKGIFRQRSREATR